MSKKSKPIPRQPEPDPSRAAPIYAALKRLGISQIEVIYDGHSDSGCIESVAALDAERNLLDGLLHERITIMTRRGVWNDADKSWKDMIAPTEVTLIEAITDWCYDVLEEHFPSWGNDDGASGTITIDVAKRKGTLDHNERVIETISHERSFS
jgi:hypothetical protein